ncbi:MAG: SRPBCC domain-containing protein [Bacteroidia bacterium]|nr:SRPBCC domain-containing protein [Bacteroidia bacterium]
MIHSPIAIIFEMISTPSGLSEWFADDVNVKEGAFVFFWDGIPNMAKLVNYKDDRLVRFQWEGRSDGKYFEFRLQTDELTNEVSLFVTDFLEEGGDLPSARLLWDKQISNLKHVLGS